MEDRLLTAFDVGVMLCGLCAIVLVAHLVVQNPEMVGLQDARDQLQADAEPLGPGDPEDL
ncbi:MAG: hypothetical protein EBS89_07510 [Proteobacteria bacterium]|nr:hypothetical protein [Pseudomonadota bacterium]